MIRLDIRTTDVFTPSGLLFPLEMVFMDFACHDASCSPPPVGAGGSRPSIGNYPVKDIKGANTEDLRARAQYLSRKSTEIELRGYSGLPKHEHDEWHDVETELKTRGEFGVELVEFACHDASCRPPTSGGTGGSRPKGGVSISSAGQHADLAHLRPKDIEEALKTIHTLPGTEHIKTLDQAVDYVTDQLRATIQVAGEHGFTPEMAQVAAHWYPVAHDYIGKLTGEYGYNHPETGAAVMATLSPSAEWGSNVTNGREVLRMVSENPKMEESHVDLMQRRAISALESALATGKQKASWSEEKQAALEAELEHAKSPEFRAQVSAKILGKHFNDLDLKDAAVFMQAHIQGNAMKATGFVVNPDGKSYGIGETTSKAIIQSTSNFMKALEFARADKAGASIDAMQTLIDRKVSNESKVRAFYMNLAYPHDRDQNAVTVDTHALGSLTGIPFNAVTSKPYFMSGTEAKRSKYANAYPIFRAAMERVMPDLVKLGVDPSRSTNAVQSVVWEMERFLLPKKPKGTFIKTKATQDELTRRRKAGESPLDTKRWVADQMGEKGDRVETPVGSVKDYTVDE